MSEIVTRVPTLRLVFHEEGLLVLAEPAPDISDTWRAFVLYGRGDYGVFHEVGKLNIRPGDSVEAGAGTWLYGSKYDVVAAIPMAEDHGWRLDDFIHAATIIAR